MVKGLRGARGSLEVVVVSRHAVAVVAPHHVTDTAVIVVSHHVTDVTVVVVVARGGSVP